MYYHSEHVGVPGLLFLPFVCFWITLDRVRLFGRAFCACASGDDACGEVRRQLADLWKHATPGYPPSRSKPDSGSCDQLQFSRWNDHRFGLPIGYVRVGRDFRNHLRERTHRCARHFGILHDFLHANLWMGFHADGNSAQFCRAALVGDIPINKYRHQLRMCISRIGYIHRHACVAAYRHLFGCGYGAFF